MSFHGLHFRGSVPTPLTKRFAIPNVSEEDANQLAFAGSFADFDRVLLPGAGSIAARDSSTSSFSSGSGSGSPSTSASNSDVENSLQRERERRNIGNANTNALPKRPSPYFHKLSAAVALDPLCPVQLFKMYFPIMLSFV